MRSAPCPGGACVRSRARRVRAASPAATAPPPPSPLAGRLGQHVNLPGIAQFLRLLVGRDAALAVPHLRVRSVAQLDWASLRREGFAGAVLDKDGTVTPPYALAAPPAAAAALRRAAAAFGPGRVALLSNAAGYAPYDPGGGLAGAVEAALGVPVLRHSARKPAGPVAEALAAQLRLPPGSPPHLLVLVGDRLLTDIVYGNATGMLTVLVEEPLEGGGEGGRLRAEGPAVGAARWLEAALARRAARRGTQPPPHPLLGGRDARRLFVVGASEEGGVEGAAGRTTA